jgi:NADH-quinone oxidoreductase subunit C
MSKLRTPKQIEAARRNGAKSRGPVTPEGKARSSQNARQHGFTSETLVLSNEDEERFHKLLDSYTGRFHPIDEVEADLVLELVANRWRMRRIWSLETAVLDYEMDAQEKEVEKKYASIDETTRLALAWMEQAKSSSLGMIHRYETRFRRNYERALANLQHLQATREETLQNEPEPAQPLPAGGLTPSASLCSQTDRIVSMPEHPAKSSPAAVMASTPWNDELTAALTATFGGSILETAAYAGQEFLLADAAAIPAVLEYLKDQQGFDYLVDLTAVDYPQREARFELVYTLYSFPANRRIRVKSRVKEDSRPASVVGIHAGANWLEREIFDMFGIEFSGHPDMKRILLPDEWHGHPLRKDYSIIKMDNRWVKENLGIESGQ